MQNKKAYVWGLITRVGPAAIQILTNMILARFLSPEDFGTVGVLTIIFTVANVLVDSGLGGSLVKEKDITRIDCSTISTFNLSVSSLLFVILFLFAPFTETYFDIEGLTGITRLLSLTFILGAIGLVPRALLIRDLQFGKLCFITIAAIGIAAISSIAMAYWGMGVYALVGYQLINSLMTTAFAMVFTKYKDYFGFSIDSFKRLIPFGIFTSVTSVIDTIYENLLTTLTGKYLNVAQAGYLSQAKKLEEGLSTSVASTIGNISFPILTKLKDDSKVFQKEAWSLFRTIVILSFPVLLVVSLFAEPLISLLFGKTWAPASYYLQALIWAGLLLIMETTVRSFIKALCEVKKLMNATLLKRSLGIIIIFCALIANPEWILIAYIVSTFVGLIINVFLYTKISGQSSISCFASMVKYLLPPMAFYLLGLLCTKMISSVILCIALVLALLIMYYGSFALIYKKQKSNV